MAPFFILTVKHLLSRAAPTTRPSHALFLERRTRRMRAAAPELTWHTGELEAYGAGKAALVQVQEAPTAIVMVQTALPQHRLLPLTPP